MAAKDYSNTPSANTAVGPSPGTFIGPNMPRDNVRPALQQHSADLRELYDEMIAMGGGGTLPQFIASGTAAVTRSVQDKLRDAVSVKDFGAKGDGTTDDTAAITAAFTAAGGSAVFFPQGTYKVSNLPILAVAGARIIGASRYTTKLLVAPGTTGSVFSNPNAGVSTSAFAHFSDLFIDLNNQNVVAIDLSSMNNCVVERVRFVGGPNKAGSTGTAVQCASPAGVGSYNNRIAACDFTYMSRGISAVTAGNLQTIQDCEFLSGDIGVDVASGVDSVRIFGGRFEGCNIGVRDAGRETGVIAARFESQSTADVSFLTGSDRCAYIGCYTASTLNTIIGEGNCGALWIEGGSFPQRRMEPNLSNPMVQSARQTFAAASSTAAIHANPSNAVPGVSNYAAYFYDNLFLNNNAASIEAVNATNDNTVQALYVDSSNRVNIPGYDRKAGAYTRIVVGPNFSFNGTGLEYAGVKVVGARQTGTAANATDLATALTLVNDLKAKLIAHGLIS